MIDLPTVEGADTCEECAGQDRFCLEHLHAFVGLQATTREDHKRRMAAVASWPRLEADNRQARADHDLEKNVRRILINRPQDMGRLLLLAVEVHESRSAAIQLELSAAVTPGRR